MKKVLLFTISWQRQGENSHIYLQRRHQEAVPPRRSPELVTSKN